MQMGDKVFGWSSGWQRYVTTVTAMEKLSLDFELDAARYVLSRATLTAQDLPAFLDIAKQFTGQIEARRSEETAAWVTEFNAGLAALSDVIRVQKEASDKAVAARRDEAKPGAIEVGITQGTTPPKPVSVYLDGDAATARKDFMGASVVFSSVSGGLHSIRVVRDEGKAGGEMVQEKSVTVTPGASVQVSVSFA
jgi:hypothetical protein